MINLGWLYALSVVLIGFTLPIFSYLTLIYRELGRMTTGRVHEHLEIFEAEIEPKLKINRKSGGRTFRIIGHFWLAFLVLETTRGVVYFVPGTWESFVEYTTPRVVSSTRKASQKCPMIKNVRPPLLRLILSFGSISASKISRCS